MSLIVTYADQILLIGAIAFAASQLVQILHARKIQNVGISYISLVIFALVVWSMAITYWSIGLHQSGAMVAFSATLWTAMIIQKQIYEGELKC